MKGTWGVILMIRTFFKAKKPLSVNTEHQLKSKLTWPKFPKSMKLKQEQTGAMTAAKNAIFIGL